MARAWPGSRRVAGPNLSRPVRAGAGLMVKLVYTFAPRAMTKLTGRDPQTGNGIEPMKIWAHQPKMMTGMGRFSQAIRSSSTVTERIRNLVELKGAQMIGCAFWVDLCSRRAPSPRPRQQQLLA